MSLKNYKQITSIYCVLGLGDHKKLKKKKILLLFPIAHNLFEKTTKHSDWEGNTSSSMTCTAALCYMKTSW